MAVVMLLRQRENIIMAGQRSYVITGNSYLISASAFNTLKIVNFNLRVVRLQSLDFQRLWNPVLTKPEVQLVRSAKKNLS
jgi:hypothetical protein